MNYLSYMEKFPSMQELISKMPSGRLYKVKTMSKKKEFFNKLVPRFKSFGWRVGMMFVAGGIEVLIQTLSEVNFDSEWTVVLGLILGEVSKYLNKKSVR